MDALVVFGLLVALAWLAPRFGSDSRDRVRSSEERLAASGVRWERR